MMTAATATRVAPDTPAEVATLYLPDWEHLDTVWRSPLPFALWSVGDQPILYHWLDYCLNRGFGEIVIFCADRPAEVRQAMERATLWPLRWTLYAVSEIDVPENAYCLNRMPWDNGTALEPSDGWELLDYWFKLESQWFENSFSDDEVANLNLAIGRYCNIHRSTKINMPVWIGDRCYIGPNCEIGPHVTIGEQSVLAGNNRLRHAKVDSNTFLGVNTQLDGSFLHGGRLLNLQHRADVLIEEMHIAGSLESVSRQKAPFLERLLAFFLWVFFKHKAFFGGGKSYSTRTEMLSGRELRTMETSPVWQQRLPWFWEVVRGHLRLVGILPRTRRQLDGVDNDWREILRSAPSGIFSYADTQGVHSPEEEMEALHAVYQATHSTEEMKKIVWQYIRQLMRQ